MPCPNTLGRPGVLRRDLVVVHRVEVTGRARVHHEVGAAEGLAELGRGVALRDVVVEQLLLTHTYPLSVLRTGPLGPRSLLRGFPAPQRSLMAAQRRVP